MLPTLREHDLLLVRYKIAVRLGDVVLATFSDGTLVVKRATEKRTLRTGGLGWWLTSDNPHEGVDSRHRGPVAEHDIQAVVVFRVWPPRLLSAVNR
jgi:SOS-response transcriptional repressor LexA